MSATEVPGPEGTVGRAVVNTVRSPLTLDTILGPRVPVPNPAFSRFGPGITGRYPVSETGRETSCGLTGVAREPFVSVAVMEVVVSHTTQTMVAVESTRDPGDGHRWVQDRCLGSYPGLRRGEEGVYSVTTTWSFATTIFGSSSTAGTTSTT